jgi:hypothetical protein
MQKSPFVHPWKNRVEMFNELVVLGVAILTTAFAEEPNEEMGWFIIVLITIQAMVNFVINIVVNARKWYAWVRQKWNASKNSTTKYGEVENTERKSCTNVSNVILKV